MAGIGGCWARRRHVVTAAFALLLALAGPSRADAPPYPVWWSPLLELESLEDIDARLERAVWPDRDEGLRLYSGSGDDLVEAQANNCLQLKELTEAGYFGGGSPDIWLQHYQFSICKAIEFLKTATPSDRSSVQDLAFDVETVNVMPAMVNLSPSCDFICREGVANERRISLSQLHDVGGVEIISESEMKYWSEDWQIRLVIVAHGDFDADGAEDLLLLSSGGSISGTSTWAELFLLSRYGRDEVLWIKNVENHLCPEYQCQPSYDYPEVLNEPSEESMK